VQQSPSWVQEAPGGKQQRWSRQVPVQQSLVWRQAPLAGTQQVPSRQKSEQQSPAPWQVLPVKAQQVLVVGSQWPPQHSTSVRQEVPPSPQQTPFVHDPLQQSVFSSQPRPFGTQQRPLAPQCRPQHSALLRQILPSGTQQVLPGPQVALSPKQQSCGESQWWPIGAQQTPPLQTPSQQSPERVQGSWPAEQQWRSLQACGQVWLQRPQLAGSLPSSTQPPQRSGLSGGQPQRQCSSRARPAGQTAKQRPLQKSGRAAGQAQTPVAGLQNPVAQSPFLPHGSPELPLPAAAATPRAINPPNAAVATALSSPRLLRASPTHLVSSSKRAPSMAGPFPKPVPSRRGAPPARPRLTTPARAFRLCRRCLSGRRR
jgi:hypothetical protein